MVTEQVLFKADKNFIKDIDAAVKAGNYQSRTEFIRESLRKNMDEQRLKKIAAEIESIRGAAKKRVSPEEYERVRQEVFKEFDRKLR
jgi:Arc/MetJ-type ribon-helix-helix transcriptional regulator